MLARSTRRRARLVHRRTSLLEGPEPAPPPVKLLLEIDDRYRTRAEAGRLRTIAPRRFNPERKSWLPILHVERDGWSLTAIYSNTARAHDLGRTRDWVVIYFERDGHEGQCTVVTETRGDLEGRRVVRGREGECARVPRESSTAGGPTAVANRAGRSRGARG
jgi:DNA polymerase (family 10)